MKNEMDDETKELCLHYARRLGLNINTLETFMRRRVAPSVEKATVSLKNLVHELDRMREAEYRRVFGHLPGSNRTSRLRKKRRKAIDEWYCNRMNEVYDENILL